MLPEKRPRRRSSNERFWHAATREGIEVAAYTFLVEPRSASNGEMWATLVAKFPAEDNAAVSTAAAVACLARATKDEDGEPSPVAPGQ